MQLFQSKSNAQKTAVAVVEEAPKRQAGTQQSIDIKAENIKSMIAAGETFEGDMRLRHGLKLDGTVIGKIEFGSVDGLLVLNQTSVVEGDIYGPRAIILGEVRGNIVVTGKLILMPSARISGDIAYGSIHIAEGAQLAGRICPIADMQQPAIQAETPHNYPAQTTQGNAPHIHPEESAPSSSSVLNFTASAAAAGSR